MKILVTGGAGYVGSHATRALLDRGDSVVVLDQLTHGHRKAVDPRAKFVLGSTGDPVRVLQVLRTEKIDAVLHFATDAAVTGGRTPEKLYSNNVSNTIRLLESMKVAGVMKIVFSSSTAVYGDARSSIRDESRMRLARRPYGRSMMMCEMIIEDFAHAHELGYAILRYDNAIGAHPSAELGDDDAEERHLLTRLLHFASRESGPSELWLDGSRVWDCLHVMDVVRAHLLALDRLEVGHGDSYNLSSGAVYSANELIKVVEEVVGRKLTVASRLGRNEESPDEPLSSKKIRELGWHPVYPDLETMIIHAWNWHRLHPSGYEDPPSRVKAADAKWDEVDEASWESFPASDPPGYIPAHASGGTPIPAERQNSTERRASL